MTLIPSFVIFFFVYICFGFVLAQKQKRNDLVDMMWGPGIAGFSWLAFAVVGSGFGWVLPLIITIWALRLSLHIALRANNNEDARYAAWREEWMKKGERYFQIRSFFQVFFLQGILMIAVALPVVLAMYFGWGTMSVQWWQIIGLLIWIEGFTIETLADWQLSDFLARKHAGLETSKYMTHGIWGWSRHPNYFGEVEQWWGVFLIALTPQAPWTWLGIISALTITFLILKVSGIPILEAQFEDDPEYQDYQQQVNAFFPWPPQQKDIQDIQDEQTEDVIE